MRQSEALEILKTGVNVFLTGAPGAGKTHVINQYIQYLRLHDVWPAMTASTGIAATHIGGSTIHAFSGIGIHKYINDYTLDAILSKERVVKKIRETQVLIIDEVSMLDAQTLDNVNMVCKAVRNSREAFGGMQVVLVGDFFQLPPVGDRGSEKQFAFQSKAFQEAKLLTCYIEEQHRQGDGEFLDLLLAIRQKRVTDAHYDLLDQRVRETKKVLEKSASDMTQLFTHNRDVDSLNEKELGKITGKEKVYTMKSFGRKSMTEALIKSCLAPQELRLRAHAKVMCVKNNPEEGYVNGSLGEVVDLGESVIKVRLANGRLVEVEESEWSIEEDGKVLARILQFPLRLAWAITVHKSQGMSLDSAFMDLGQTFEYGQGYVALSRVRSLDGLFLGTYSEMTLSVDETVFAFDSRLLESSKVVQKRFLESDKHKLANMQQDFILKCGGSLIENADNIKQKDDFSNFKKEAKPDTHLETLKYLKEGLTFDKIAKKRLLKESTIVSHIEDLKKENKITKGEVKSAIPKKYHKIPADVKTAFKKLGSEKLAPVYQELSGEYTHEELRICRLLLV